MRRSDRYAQMIAEMVMSTPRPSEATVFAHASLVVNTIASEAAAMLLKSDGYFSDAELRDWFDEDVGEPNGPAPLPSR